MVIVLLTLGLMITCIVILFIGTSDISFGVGVGGLIVFGLAVAFMTVICIGENMFHDRMVSSLNEERAALVYQMDHNLYLGDAIGEFNSKVVYHQMGHQDPWTSWFHGSYWMEIDPIDLGGAE